MNIQTVTYNGISFLNVHDPQELEIKFLRKHYGFNPLDLEDYVNKTQIPKIESFKGYMLVVLDFPYVNQQLPSSPSSKQPPTQEKKFPSLSQMPLPQISLPSFTSASKKRRIFVGQVDFFIGKDYLVVLHDERTPQIDAIFAQCQQTLKYREDFMGEGSIFLFYRLVDVLVDQAFAVTNELSSVIDYIDRELTQNRSQNVVEDISITRRNIVVFQTMIKPALPIFSDLDKKKYPELNGSMTPFWSNILDHLQKIWERLEDSKELIAGISESNESILTFRTNEIVKFLTVITSISFPFVIVNNLYSMNVVGLPFAQHPGIVYVLFVLIFIGAAGIILYFKYRRWL